jgi:hypothetical protein
LKLLRKDEYVEKRPDEIIKSIESGDSLSVKNNANWCNKIARYMAYCLDGGLM